MEITWIVWKVNGNMSKCFHKTLQSAREEVEWLAKMNPTDTFIIFESVAINRPVITRSWEEA